MVLGLLRGIGAGRTRRRQLRRHQLMISQLSSCSGGAAQVEGDHAGRPDEDGQGACLPDWGEGARDKQRHRGDESNAELLAFRQTLFAAKGVDVGAKYSMANQPVVPALAAAGKEEGREQEKWRRWQERGRDTEKPQSNGDEPEDNVETAIKHTVTLCLTKYKNANLTRMAVLTIIEIVLNYRCGNSSQQLVLAGAGRSARRSGSYLFGTARQRRGESDGH